MPNSKSPLSDAYLAGPGPHMLELGAGTSRKPGWLPSDYNENQVPQATAISLDVTERFQFDNETFDFIYCEHMIEHLSLTSGQFMLKESHRILKPGGVLRIVTPSIGFLLRIMSPDRNILEQSYLEWSVKSFVPTAPAVTNAVFLNNFVRAWGHKFIYDHDTLRLVLKEAGFIDVRPRAFARSEHRALTGLENAKRMPVGYLELESMIFEGVK